MKTIENVNEYYLIMEYSSNYNEEVECRDFKIIDFSNLIVNEKDELVIVPIKNNGINTILEITNFNNDTSGLIEAYYFSDDAREYLNNSVCKYFKDKHKHVTVSNFLVYEKEEIGEYMDALGLHANHKNYEKVSEFYTF